MEILVNPCQRIEINMLRKKLLGRSICLGFLPVLLIAGRASAASNSANYNPPCSTDYWVSTSGDDNSPSGSASAPFLTLDRARLAVRQNKFRGRCTINVNIQGGIYTLTTPLIFDRLDSGSAQAKVVYQAASGNTSPVVISGGIPVTGFS